MILEIDSIIEVLETLIAVDLPKLEGIVIEVRKNGKTEIENVSFIIEAIVGSIFTDLVKTNSSKVMVEVKETVRFIDEESVLVFKGEVDVSVVVLVINEVKLHRSVNRKILVLSKVDVIKKQDNLN